MKNSTILGSLLVTLILTLILAPSAQAVSCAYYFYGDDCQGCAGASQSLDHALTNNPNFQLEKKEVFYSSDNKELLSQYFKAYGIAEESQALPVVFFPQTYLIGEEPIRNLIQENIVNNDGLNCPTIETKTAVGVIGKHFPYSAKADLPFITLSSGALKDAMQPGILALILLLLILIAYHKESSEAARGSFAFIFATFLVYLLFALGYFTWFAQSFTRLFFYRLVAIIGIVYGFFVVKSFFWKWKFVTLSDKAKNQSSKLAALLSSPLVMFIVGAVTSLYSFAKISPVMWSLRNINFGGVWLLPMLIYYCLIVILPLAIVAIIILTIKKKFFIYAEGKDGKLEMWLKHYHEVLKVLIGITCLIFGLVLMFL
ncbi:hypothetical protein J4437_06150 [Candidatus Woesearchaeota archaeon]|nr:hypothetical protein [Candidatus Woesearchaeota archaeon]